MLLPLPGLGNFLPPARIFLVGPFKGEIVMKRIAVLLIASAAFAAPAIAEEVGVGVGVGPVGAGVTVGSGPDRVVKEKEVVREREPRDKVIIQKDRRPDVVEKKTIIKDRD
jgi:hypothetical protein